MTDEQLIAQLKQGDRNAFKNIYLDYKTEYLNFMKCTSGKIRLLKKQCKNLSFWYRKVHAF